MTARSEPNPPLTTSESVSQSANTTLSGVMNSDAMGRAPARASHTWLVPTLVVAVGLLLLFWLVERNRIDRMQVDVARRLAAADAQIKEAGNNAQRAEGTTRDANARMQALELRVAENQSQQAALENLYQDLARNRDDTVIIEVEQTVVLASQQLQLTGNVAAAIAALQAAETRLGRADKQVFAPLRRAVQRDLDKLRALPDMDISSQVLAIDQLVQEVDQWPLLSGEPASATERASKQTSTDSWWARMRSDAWTEFKSLVRIRRASNTDAMFLAPEQAWLLRENIKLRLLNARLALVSRQEAAFRASVVELESTLNRYFDTSQRNVKAARDSLVQFKTSTVAIQTPTLNESLSAVRQARNQRTK